MRKGAFPKFHPKGRRILPGLNKKLLFAMVVVAAIALAAGGFTFKFLKRLGRSDFFQITTIDIQGCRKTNKKQILQLSGMDIHSNLLSLRTEEVQRRIEGHDWIKRTTVKKVWPNQLLITVEERQPLALVALGDGFFYLDRDGYAFSRALPPEDLDFPVITGLKEAPKGVAKGDPLEDIFQFLRHAAMGDSNLPKQNISEIHVDEKGDLTLYLVNRPFPVSLGRGDMATAYRQLARVLHGLYKKNEFAKTAYIRLRYQEDKVLVGFESAAVSAPATTDDKKKGRGKS